MLFNILVINKDRATKKDFVEDGKAYKNTRVYTHPFAGYFRFNNIPQLEHVGLLIIVIIITCGMICCNML